MDYERPRIRWYTHLADFANTLKAFIGSNYLTIAFAFKQSGLIMGVIGLLLIAFLTDHCCHLIVKAKYFAIRRKIASTEEQDQTPSSISSSSDNYDDSAVLIENETFHTMTYGDIANFAFGKIGLYIVNACIVFTQYGFCVAYFIFIGNTIFNLFPYKTCYVSFSNASDADKCVPNGVTLNVDSLLTVNNHLYINDSYTNISQNHIQSAYKYPLSLGASNSEQMSSYMTELLNTTTAAITTETTTATNQTTTSSSNTTTTAAMTTMMTITTTTAVPTTSPVLSVNWTHLNDTILMTTAPSTKYLVLVPVPIFILFAFIRNMRHLGVVSATANMSILIGCVAVFIFLLVDFSVSDHYELFDLRNSLVFFGLVTASFEGIGCVIPIESSMKGNRHNFPLFLHGAVFFLTFVLLLFGVLGYLRFGKHVAQMININIPPGSMVSLTVNICLCVGVVLTFPLQLFPVIQLAEIFVFGEGQLCGPAKQRLRQNIRRYDDATTADSDTEQGDTPDVHQVLIPDSSTSIADSTPEAISHTVPTWKRNILRTFIVLSAAGFAVLFRNSFAYISGFVGSIGSTTLAYIMPSLIHTKLGGAELKRSVILKNYVILVIGVVCGLASLCTIIIELINQTSVD